MCPSETYDILLFLKPPQSCLTANFPDFTYLDEKEDGQTYSGVSNHLRVSPTRPQSHTGQYFQAMERRYPELITIRPKLMQEYPTHTIHFGRRLLTEEKGSIAHIKKSFSAVDPNFAYGTLFKPPSVNNYIRGRRKQAGYSPSLRHPQPQTRHLTKAAVHKLEKMASQQDFKLASRARTHSFDVQSRDLGPNEKRSAVYKAMLENHEHVIDSSEDEKDEGGIPAWVAMRRSLYAKNMNPPGQDLSGQPLTSYSAAPSTSLEFNILADISNDGTGQGNTGNVDNDSESSGNRGEITPTESEFQPASYLDHEISSLQRYSVGPSTQEASSLEPSASYEYNYTEYYSGDCKVMRGGFALAKENARPKVMSEPFITYPPLSNRGYMLTSTGHDPKFAHRVEQVYSTFIPRSFIKRAFEKRTAKTLLEPIVTTEELNEEDLWVDSDGDVSEATETGGWSKLYSPFTVFALCRVCNKRHIPPGSFMSLEERDSCASYLPDWFPAKDFEFPWTAFNDLNNEFHRLESLERGITFLPKNWDKVYHQEHPVWKALGYVGGGFWRCRSRQDPNAPVAERRCELCHVHYPPKADRLNPETMQSAMKALEQLRTLTRGHMARVGQQDKAIALKMIRETMMRPSRSLLANDSRTLMMGGPTSSNKAEDNEEQTPKNTTERMILQAMWDHQGPVSTLDVSDIPNDSASVHGEVEDEEDEEDAGLTMKSTSRRARRRPAPLTFHRQTSSLGSNFFSAFITPLQSPRTPTVPEERLANSQ